MGNGEEQPKEASSTAPFGPPTTQRVEDAALAAPLTVRFRSPNWVVVIVATGATMLLASVLLFAPLVNGGSGNGADVASSERVGIAIAVVMGWLVFLRVLRVRLVLDEHGIRVCNFVRTHRVAWTDVRHVACVRRVTRLNSGGTVQTVKVYIVVAEPIASSAAVVSYGNRAVTLKPVIDVCHARNVAVYDV